MKNVLFVTDGLFTPSGFGMVVKNLIRELKEDYNIAMVSWQHVGGVMEHDGIKIYPIDKHQFGKDAVPYAIKDFKPDVVITLGDYWMLNYMAEDDMKSLMEKNSIKWIWYLPIDSDIVPIQFEDVITKPDVLVAMSKHGSEVLTKLDVKHVYIPHGTRTDLYKRLDNRNELRKEYGYEGKFVIGCVARNQPRKMLPRLIKAFSIFAKDKDDVVIHFHNDLLDPGNIIRDYNKNAYSILGQAICVYKVEEKVKFTKNMKSFVVGLDEDKLPGIYNLFDIHAIPTSGEGFGLPILESMACGIPNVLTDFTTAKEFIGNDNQGIRVPIKTMMFGGYGTHHALIDEEKMAEAFEELYKNKSTRADMGSNARELAKQYDWTIVAKKWRELIG